MTAYTVAQCISWLVYLTGTGSRQLAKLLPVIYQEPVLVDDDELHEDADGNMLVKVELLGEETLMRFVNLTGGSRTPDGWEMPVNPTEALEWLMATHGEVFLVEEGEEEYYYVSPLLALRLGDGGGGQLNLYTEVVYRFMQLYYSGRDSEDKVWLAEYKQWKASHKAVLKSQMKGDGDSDKAGLVAKATRGKGVRSFKCGAWIGRVKDVHGTWHTFKPGFLYFSSESPMAKLGGKTAFPWRNPMTLISFLPIVIVGPKTAWCPNPTWETDRVILPDTKGYLHPLSISDKAGDVDGDGLQFGILEVLLNWAMQNWNIVTEYSGLAESLIEHFFDEVE